MNPRNWIAISTLWISATAAIAQVGGIVSAPYTAMRKSSNVQTLSDGTTILRTTTVKEARDSQGRTYRETKFDNGSAALGRPQIISFNVVDPVARITMSWSSQTKVVTLFHMSEPRPGQTSGNGTVAGAITSSPTFLGVAPPPEVIPQPPPAQQQANAESRPRILRERLAARMIAGVNAIGLRITTTYPIGYIGNDRPIVSVRETWTSPDLHMVVFSSETDPRTGVHTAEVSDLDRNEPSPTLFQAPEGYTVREQKPLRPLVQ
jgi:hypothetical protein